MNRYTKSTTPTAIASSAATVTSASTISTTTTSAIRAYCTIAPIVDCSAYI